MEKSKTFETSMQRLEEIVRTMERGELPLEQSLELFKEGTDLVNFCGKLLDDAELQIIKLTQESDDNSDALVN